MATSSSSSSRPPSKRNSLNSIESSVTRLLVSTKHLLESLTQWARQEVDDKFVSDAYVKLGNDFRAASRAFTHAGIDISDIGDVPQALRIILEAALSEAPSQENLDRFLPNIRNIIVTLLQNLKAKQGKARSLSTEKSNDKHSTEKISIAKQRQKSPEKELQNHIHNPGMSQSQSPFRFQVQSPDHSQDELDNELHRHGHSSAVHKQLSSSPKEIPSTQHHKNEKSSDGSRSIEKTNSNTQSNETRSLEPKSTSEPESKFSFSDNRQRNMENHLDNRNLSASSLTEQDALLQLQNENVLQRRASKRFSAYQYAKLANINPSNSLPNVSSPESKRSPLSQTVRESIKERSPRRSIQEPTNDNEEAHIFLKIDNQTRKAPLKLPVTFASLRLLFVEKFAYSPGATDFPSIYIVDAKSGVSYELEDQFLSDVKDGTLLSLNDIKPQSDVSYSAKDATDYGNIEENPSWKELEGVVHSLKDKIESFDISIVSTIKNAIKDIEFPTVPLQQQTPITADAEKEDPKTQSEAESLSLSTPGPISSDVLKEVNSIEDDLKVVRQLQKANKTTIESFVADLNSKVSRLQNSGVDASKSSNRVYMEKCHSKLSDESDSLLTKVDDLQDLMEALRKDVAQRGVRVSEQQLKLTMKEINDAHRALNQMSNYINNEKGVWKKIWEAELDKVCEEQQFFNLQDDLTKDLEQDLSKIRETFDLIEQCSLEQIKQSNHRRNKIVANLYIPEPGENLSSIKDAVLNQVVSLKPDHQSRVDAINRAERLREKEREMMGLTEFQEELGNFVDDSKLKKSGGIEELERQRQLKDSENLKSSLGGI